ncbi:hypothetical protein SDC9_164605 [bioreactor metagenome]|uniref:Uncharacterized protein n=1 Tax=bioreactor metagenome TaxID=1076179 RepID=A0A645FZA5_9ZZZZ
MVEHFNMHQLILVFSKELIQGHAVLFLEMCITLLGFLGHPVPDFGVHGMVCAAAVDSYPPQFLFLRPFSELPIGSGVLDHVSDFVTGWLVPSIVVIPGVDDQDVSLFHFDALFDHVRGVDIIIAAHVGKVDDGTFMHQEVHIQLCNILSRCIEMYFSVKMCSHMVGVGHHLPVCTVGCKPLEILDL